MNVALVAVGSELLLAGAGEENGEWLTRRIESLGGGVSLRLRVGDDPERIAAAIAAAAASSRLVIVTGGLGPTEDDRTRAGIARATGLPLETDPERSRRLEAWFAARARPCTAEHRRQAERPKGASWIDNPVGSAPGFLVPGATEIIALPGVPGEMRAMFDASVAGRIRAAATFAIASRTLRTAGVPESEVDRRLEGLHGLEGLETIVLAKPSGVEVILRVRGDGPEATRRRLEGLEAEVARRLGDDLYGVDDDTLPLVVGRRLAARGRTVATAESCTAGLLGGALTDVPGSSAWYRGGVVAYADDLKTSLVGVDPETIRAHGAVSEAVALALATAIRARCGADYGLGVTGVAGPSGGSVEKPVGLVFVALAGPDGADRRELRLSGDRRQVRERSVTAALDLLRRSLPSS